MREGTVRRDGEFVVFHYERLLKHPVERAWKAITDPAEIERWTGNRPELDLRPGGEYVTRHRGGMTVVDRVVRVEPPALFEHTFWVELNPSALVTWELAPASAGCRLVLTHRLSEADIRHAADTVAAGDHPVTIMSRNAAGWHRLLDQLEDTLDGRERPWSAEDRQALQERYAELVPA